MLSWFNCSNHPSVTPHSAVCTHFNPSKTLPPLFVASINLIRCRVGSEDDPFIISLIVTSLCRWCAQSDSVFATIGYAVQVKVHHTGHQKVSNRLRLGGA